MELGKYSLLLSLDNLDSIISPNVYVEVVNVDVKEIDHHVINDQ